MLNLTQRNRIINSYSNVLCDILEEYNDFDEILSFIKNNFSKNFIEKLFITPIKRSEYEKTLKKCSASLNKDDKLVKFFFQILNRRYGYLVMEIVSMAEQKIRLKNKISNIVISTNSTLNDDMCKYILEVLKKQGITAEISYQQNKLINKDSIEFSSNGKVCILNIASLVNKALIC